MIKKIDPTLLTTRVEQGKLNTSESIDNDIMPLSTLRQARFDGEVTREALLEEACKVFAEQGYSAGSSKTICQRANVNLASVNYHFGGKSALYREVLIEAQRQLTDNLLLKLDTIGDIMSLRERVRTYLEHIFGVFLLEETPWYAKVLVREYIEPSSFGMELMKRGGFPNITRMSEMFANYFELPEDHPTVLRAVTYTFSMAMGSLAFESTLTANSDAVRRIRSDSDAALKELSFVLMTGMDVLKMSMKTFKP
ncbi:MAG: TetR/AcrR family transcriptional regulator [Pelistega sp.]|nr:TetR/AcrR family transcriptional regulator [Pelistega sp.]